MFIIFKAWFVQELYEAHMRRNNGITQTMLSPRYGAFRMRRAIGQRRIKVMYVYYANISGSGILFTLPCAQYLLPEAWGCFRVPNAPGDWSTED
jgi:hypothetical protein